MDKYELVLDIIEHPHNYTLQELEKIMEDPETREIYTLLCKVDSTIETNREIDSDEEWKAFSKKAGFLRHRLFMRGSRAASIIAIICTSIVAMAVGIAVTVAVIDNKPEAHVSDKVEKVTSPIADTAPRTEVPTISKTSENTSILFENEPLSAIMKNISAAYGVEVVFNNEEVASLHLYYKFDPTLTLDEVIAQLNTFESINIKHVGNYLIID